MMKPARTAWKSESKRYSGFTLIELLVVVAIISLLAAILFPAFAQSRENGRRTACASNMKQIGLGILQYCQDFDEYPPVGIGYSQTGCTWIGRGWGWAGQVYPYVGNTEVFTCPDDKYSGANNPVSGTSTTGPVVGYAYNPNLILGVNACPPKLGNLAQLNASSVTFILLETEVQRWGEGKDIAGAETVAQIYGRLSPYCNGVTCDNATGGSNDDFVLETGPLGCLGTSGVDWNNSLTYATDFPNGRHNGGSNFAFWDGHVKWMRGTSVSVGENATGANSTAADPCAAGSNKPAAGTRGTMSGAPVMATASIY